MAQSDKGCIIQTNTVKSQLEAALKYKPPLNSNRGFDITLKNELETALEL